MVMDIGGGIGRSVVRVGKSSVSSLHSSTTLLRSKD